MVIENKYEIGQTAYVITDNEQRMCIVTAILVRPGSIVYELSGIAGGRWFYDFEISGEKDELAKVTQ